MTSFLSFAALVKVRAAQLHRNGILVKQIKAKLSLIFFLMNKTNFN